MSAGTSLLALISMNKIPLAAMVTFYFHLIKAQTAPSALPAPRPTNEAAGPGRSAAPANHGQAEQEAAVAKPLASSATGAVGHDVAHTEHTRPARARAPHGSYGAHVSHGH